MLMAAPALKGRAFTAKAGSNLGMVRSFREFPYGVPHESVAGSLKLSNPLIIMVGGTGIEPVTPPCGS